MSEFFACDQNFFVEVTKWCQRHKVLILLFKNALKILNFENGTKTSKNVQKP
jgi:hypothetical protein